MFPWILFGLIAVPLVVIAFLASRRRTAAGERVETEDQTELEKEFAEAEAYEAKWREQDKERYRQERLP
jgi:hypothetical protein